MFVLFWYVTSHSAHIPVERKKIGNKEENWKVKKEETRAEDPVDGRQGVEQKKRGNEEGKKEGVGRENCEERRKEIKEGETKKKRNKEIKQK
jgi:hypothetical protein